MLAGQSGTSWSVGDGSVVTNISLSVGSDLQDDCAVLDTDGPLSIVLGSDYVRGPKFALHELGYLDHYDLGWYLAAANLSDIAAMGAEPIGLLSVVRYPPDLPDGQLELVLRGIKDCCAAVGAHNIGGDIGTAERLILSGSAIGVAPRGTTLPRTGARAGDRIYLTGPTGHAGAALAYARDAASHYLKAADFDELLRYWRRPKPLTEHGRLFRQHQASACIDTSDGLKAALETLAHAATTDLAFRIDRSRVPVTELLKRAATGTGLAPLDLVFGDSVDFQLVATVPAANAPQVEAVAAAAHLPLIHIGDVAIAEHGPAVRLIGEDGSEVDLPGEPWDHRH